MEIYFCQKEHLVFIQSNYFNLIFSIMIHEFLSFSGFIFDSLLFTAFCKASSDSHFAFLHCFSMGMVLIPVSHTMS